LFLRRDDVPLFNLHAVGLKNCLKILKRRNCPKLLKALKLLQNYWQKCQKVDWNTQ